MTATQSIVSRLPKHLRRYIVEQDYSSYTPIDQACWRYIMRRLTNFLSKVAHPCYLDGLKKTGIEIDSIPDINRMNGFLSKFGWSALPVSGFIPPAAFMELQSLSILPIASDMRSIDHILYTPAPDIVHEAAGHAPILVDPNFASYLKKYASVASKAIISSEDIALYEAIRNLSDIKEAPSSTKEDIQKAEAYLNKVSANMSHISEAGYLSRMNWWTAEYGLIGDLNNPKLFGAGLLSSVGESETCLSKDVKKIPLTVDCIKYSYNITEPQPQLFVTKDFAQLESVLEDLAKTMAFRTGGLGGLLRAVKAKTVNTAVYSSGLQVSGVLNEVVTDESGTRPIYLIFKGPCTISIDGKLLPGHGIDYHSQGFGSPVGQCPELKSLIVDKSYSLKFDTGIELQGAVKNIKSSNGLPMLITFSNCIVSYKGRILFEPSWGLYDMIVGDTITSVFGGPADRENYYSEEADFAVKIIPKRVFSEREKELHRIYKRVREIRNANTFTKEITEELLLESKNLQKNYPEEWLVQLEIHEFATGFGQPILVQQTVNCLEKIMITHPEKAQQIKDGLSLPICLGN